MFGDLFGNMEAQQAEMRKKLAAITLEAEAGNGAVRVKVNAAREVLNIAFDRSLMDWDDTEQVEDMVTIAINRALALAMEREAAETQRLIQEMLPPGMSGLMGGL